MFLDEEQKAIEDDFLRSWDNIERSFEDMIRHSGLEHMTYMLSLIPLLRAHGYDRKLHAGQSMARLILSRSLKNGLRPKQPRLIIRVGRQGQMAATLVSANEDVTLGIDRVEINPELENLLLALLVYPID